MFLASSPTLSPLEKARFNMIEQQVRPWDVLDQAVLEVMKEVPRESFVPDAYRSLAFSDVELPLGHGEKMLSPKVIGRILQELAIMSDDTCLEIGTGSGYLTACMAKMAKMVYSVEYHKQISFMAQERLDYQSLFNVMLDVADASQNWSSDEVEHFDIIAITASMPSYNPNYEKKLSIGGRLFAFVGTAPAMQAMLITRLSENEYSRVSLFETEVKALIGTDHETFAF